MTQRLRQPSLNVATLIGAVPRRAAVMLQPIVSLRTHSICYAVLTAPPCPGWRPLACSRPAGRRSLQVVASKRMSEADLYVGINPTPPPQPAKGGAPWYVAAPLSFVALIAVLRTAKAISRRNRGSLEARNLRGTGVADDAYYSKLMRNMKKVQYEELSDDQIASARRRRSREVALDQGPSIDDIELPDNHPFAVKQQLSQQEEEVQRLRLSTRRGLSPEDMRQLRQQQALADKLDAEGDARDARRAGRQGMQ